jgi:hypothetical protein
MLKTKKILKTARLAANYGMKPSRLATIFEGDVAAMVEKKFKSCTTKYDRIVVKWLGWLLTFLIMNKNEKKLFIEDDRAVDATIDELTKDLHGLNQRKPNRSKSRTTEDNS